MDDLADAICDALGGKRTARGWSCRCPMRSNHRHDDKHPSLDMVVKHGKVLFHCRAGCDQSDVLDALVAQGLWGAPMNTENRVATYEYRDAQGTLLALKDRYEQDGKKSFGWRDRHGNSDLNGDKPLLFGAELLKGAALVLLVEGEKAALAGREAGFVAVCSPNGAGGTFEEDYARLLRGKDVVLLPDNDDPGRKHMYAALAALKPFAATIRGVPLEVGEKGDLVDYFIAHTPADLTALIESHEPAFVNPHPHAYHTMHTAMANVFDRIVEANERGGSIPGISTGFDTLDRVIHGFQTGQYIVLGGRLSSGKSALLMTMLHHQAKRGVSVGFFSIEMGIDSVAKRFLAIDTGIDYKSLNMGVLDPSQWERVSEAIPRLQDFPIYVDDSPDLTLELLEERVTEMRRDHQIRLVAIDYLQFMKPPRAASRVQEVAALSRELKSLARRTGLPVIVLSQLSRQAEPGIDLKTGKRMKRDPRVEDIADSDQIGRDADVVLLVSRPGMYEECEPEEEHLAKVNVAKQRNGETRKITLYYDAPRMRFEDLRMLS